MLLKKPSQRAPILISFFSLVFVVYLINYDNARVGRTRKMCFAEQHDQRTMDHKLHEGKGELESIKEDDVESTKEVGVKPKIIDFDDDDILPDTIIITNATLKQPDMDWMKPGEVSFQRCPNLKSWMKCSYNPNPKEVWDRAEGVIFHGRRITRDDPVPSYRPPRQKWIFFESEPPSRIWDRVKVLNDIWGQFNFTSTYADNSDMPFSDYKLVCKQVPDWKPSGINWAENKTRSTAWWVSHCKCDTRREAYVKAMRKYISIRVMGSCGVITCGSYEEGSKCVKDLLHNQYKFYLAFENSFCKEYYTEKLTKCLRINVIPVLMGLHDYTEFMPKGSYLDVRDFRGPEHLAEYLNYLDKNDTAYNEYIERKSTVKCLIRDRLSFPCVLCQYLHENRHRRQMAPDTRVTFSVASHCISPKKFFKGIAQGIYHQLDTPKVFEESGADMQWPDEKIIV